MSEEMQTIKTIEEFVDQILFHSHIKLYGYSTDPRHKELYEAYRQVLIKEMRFEMGKQ